jgi:HSP20 family protein
MKVDIRETKDAYILEADLPGIKKDQIHLDVEQDRLLISVEADENFETKSEGYICRERRSGRIARSFPLANIDADNITASLENGTLTVNMPKKNKEMPSGRRIDIA